MTYAFIIKLYEGYSLRVICNQVGYNGASTVLLNLTLVHVLSMQQTGFEGFAGTFLSYI